MTMSRRPRTIAAPVLGFAIAIAMAACSETQPLLVGSIPLTPPKLELPNIEPGKLELPKLEPVARSQTTYSVGTTEAYTRIARGANACWFAPAGVLKGSHMFHAEVDSPAKGGRAEITIFERDPSAVSQNAQKASRALRVSIAGTEERADVGVETYKVPPPLVPRLTGDVHRWAGGDGTCSVDPNTVAAPPVVAEPTKKGKGGKTKVAKAKATTPVPPPGPVKAGK